MDTQEEINLLTKTLFDAVSARTTDVSMPSLITVCAIILRVINNPLLTERFHREVDEGIAECTIEKIEGVERLFIGKPTRSN